MARLASLVAFGLLLLLGAVACAPEPVAHQASVALVGVGAASASGECRFPSVPTVVRDHGNAILQYWEFEERALWFGSALPTDSAYVQYRRQVVEAGAYESQPAQHVPAAERANDNWRRELHNVQRAYSTEAGSIRPVSCLVALLFAFQNARYSQIDRPTEFLASILRRRDGNRTMLRVYFGAGDMMFPPKAVYGLDEVGRDVSSGWNYVAMLHNHTLQDVNGQVRLGVPAPSVSDVQLLRGLVTDLGLEQIWITNGVYMIDMSSRDLEQYLGPE